MSEQNLVRKIQSGDKAAMNEMISKYYQPVFAFFYKNVGNYHQAKDLTQEVFMKMAAGISKYRPKTPFKNWLFTIASNHLKNYYRTISRRPENYELFEDYPAPDNEVDKILILSDTQAALTRLPIEQKEAVILRFYYGFSIHDISKITGAKESTVKARIRYGLEKLKNELEGYDE